MKFKTIKLLFFFVIINFSYGFSQEFKIYDFDNFQYLLHVQDEKVHVVNFWASWCKPCVKEMPAFNQLYDEYNSRNVDIILVSLDFGKNLQEKIQAFKTNHGIKATIIVLDDPDSNSWINKVDESWSGAIPATLIYSKNKRQFYEQSFSYDELEEEIQKFINN